MEEENPMLRRIYLGTLVIALVLAGCAPAAITAPAPPPTSIPTLAPALTATRQAASYTDGLGGVVKLDHVPQHIVSLTPAITEILFAVGAGSQVVGRDEFSDYPANVKSLPSVGGSLGNYSTEQIVKLQPDLVIAGEINTPDLVKSLQDLGLTVYYLKNPTTLEEMYAQLQLFGQITGHPTDDLLASLKARPAAPHSNLPGDSPIPTPFY